MKLYLAGGFHFSGSVESEEKLARHLLEKYGRYNRLATFYYEKDANNIFEVKERMHEDGKAVKDA